MPPASGELSFFLLDFESSFGSDPGSPAAYKMPVHSMGVKSNRPRKPSTVLTGSRNPRKSLRGNMDVAGPIVAPVDSVSMFYWLKAMFGAPSTTGTGPYDHVYKVANTMPSMVLEKQFTDLATPEYFKYNGCKVARWSMDLGGSNENELQSNFEIMGANETASTSSYDASPTAIALTQMEADQMTLEEGGSSLAIADALNFTIDFGLDGDKFPIGSGGVRTGIAEHVIGVAGTLTAFFEDMTLLNKAINETETSLKVTITESASSKLVIEFPELMYDLESPTIDGPQGILANLAFQGYYDNDSQQSAVVATLTNSNPNT